MEWEAPVPDAPGKEQIVQRRSHPDPEGSHDGLASGRETQEEGNLPAASVRCHRMQPDQQEKGRGRRGKGGGREKKCVSGEV